MAAHQAPPSLGFSSQEHWSGLPFPSPMHETKEKGENDYLVKRSTIIYGTESKERIHPLASLR